MDTTTGVQSLDKGVGFSHISTTHGKGMNPSVLSPTMEEIELFNLLMETSLGEGKLNIQTC